MKIRLTILSVAVRNMSWMHNEMSKPMLLPVFCISLEISSHETHRNGIVASIFIEECVITPRRNDEQFSVLASAFSVDIVSGAATVGFLTVRSDIIYQRIDSFL